MSLRQRLTIVLALAALASASPRVARAEDPQANAEEARSQSRAAFKKGVAQLRSQDWKSARASFEQAWSLFPHPSILLNLGIARLKTGDPVLAEQDLVRFLSEDGGATAEELASAREALAEARAKIGTLRVVVSPLAARVTVDGKPLELLRRTDSGEALSGEARASAGRHAIAATAEGFTSEQRDVEVSGKGETEVKLVLTARDAAPPENKPGGGNVRTVVGWSAVGLAGAALVTSGVFGLRAMSLADDYADPSSSRFQDADTRSSGVGFRTGADVALGVAVLSGAAAVILLLTDIGAPSGPKAAAHNAHIVRW